VNVRTEAAGPNGRTIAVEVNDQDGRESFPDWDSMSINDRFRRLSAKADSLLVFYLARENIITPEYARQRMAALKQAMA
jgi:hypothetical protein